MIYFITGNKPAPNVSPAKDSRRRFARKTKLVNNTYEHAAPDSFGVLLRMLRESAGLSLDKLSELAKINKHYIEYLENEEFGKLPPPVYIRGFIARCGKLLGEHKTSSLLRLYAARTNQKLETQTAIRENKAAKISFVLRPEHLAFILASFFLLTIIVFLAARFTPFLFEPNVEVFKPLSENTIINFPVLDIEGRAHLSSVLTLNGDALYIGEKGLFSKTLELEEGVNRIVFTAKNIFGRKIEVVKRVVYIKNN